MKGLDNVLCCGIKCSQRTRIIEMGIVQCFIDIGNINTTMINPQHHHIMIIQKSTLVPCRQSIDHILYHCGYILRVLQRQMGGMQYHIDLVYRYIASRYSQYLKMSIIVCITKCAVSCMGKNNQLFSIRTS